MAPCKVRKCALTRTLCSHQACLYTFLLFVLHSKTCWEGLCCLGLVWIALLVPDRFLPLVPCRPESYLEDMETASVVRESEYVMMMSCDIMMMS